jgi:monolysocardiolipin acyltransferase
MLCDGCSIMSARDDLYPNTEVPSFFWRSASYQTILLVATLSRLFLFGLNKTEVHGLPRFLDLLKSRAEYKTRQRGLVTVSNHISVLDDPLIWGVLPLSFTAVYGYMNHRWTLASHDICFKGPLRSHFFTLGQTLPIHRLAHSPHGGAFQATMAEGVRLLSKITARKLAFCPFNNRALHGVDHTASWPRDCVDPFSDVQPAPSYPSQPEDNRLYFAPSRYACNSYSWVHVFPEGVTHQSPDKTLRYFKWGVARLILEPTECPDVVPMFIEGTDQVMHESRGFPRFIPRAGKNITVTFGKEVDTEAVFGDLRKRWRELTDETTRASGWDKWNESLLGVLPSALTDGQEAIDLRKECARRMREEVLKVRRSRGLPDLDPKSGLLETWAREGGKREGKMEDGTWVKDT